jgi:polyprenyl synthetase
MDHLSLIHKPIRKELEDFVSFFNNALSHNDGLLSQVLEHIRNRGGKRMRPILILLMTKSFGSVTSVAQHAAVGLELLHTASLVHDDVVDESGERRGQASVNASYNNKVAVLVGDYILSTALLNMALTDASDIVRDLAELGRTLSNGEILQLTNISNSRISEEVYFQVVPPEGGRFVRFRRRDWRQSGWGRDSTDRRSADFWSQHRHHFSDSRRYIRLFRFKRNR